MTAVIALSSASKAQEIAPKKEEKPILGLKSNKNFIITNAVENILSGKL